jgi:hypothetical protein
MADRSPLEEPLRRVMDANARYYEALGQITQEYWKAVFGVFRDLPVRFGSSGAPPAAAASQPPTPNPTAPAAAATLVLEGGAGVEAQGVFMVENRLTRTVSTAVVTSAFTDPSGRTYQPTMRVTPTVVTLQPGGRTLVQIAAVISDDLEPDAAYRGEVSVPGLSEHGIPVLMRRLSQPKSAAQPAGSATAGATVPGAGSQQGDAATKSPPKKSASKKSTSKSASKKSATKSRSRTASKKSASSKSARKRSGRGGRRGGES